MRTFCISLPETPERRAAAEEHFKAMGVQAEFITGIHGETSGLMTTHPYDYDQKGWIMPRSAVGLVLSHYMAWTVCSFLPDDCFLILEDDCQFSAGWQERFIQAIIDTPCDYDVLLIGSCNSCDKEKTHVKGEIWDVRYPFCNHATLIAKKALPVLLQERKIWAKLDVALYFGAYTKLKVYTVLPRICDQRGTELTI